MEVNDILAKTLHFMFAKPMNFQPKNKMAFEGITRGRSF
jgi:hypothetical protein